MASDTTQELSARARQLGSYGAIEMEPLSRIALLSSRAMARNWSTIPHVTHHDLIDVTRAESLRERLNAGREPGERLSPLPFLMKAIASVLKTLERFNSALDESGEQLILRRYVNLGFAVDAPCGLMVPVIRSCDSKTIDEIGQETRVLAEKARGKGLALSEMSGGGFTVSSLGRLGGTGFTPIINGPEVAILGVSRTVQTPHRTSEGGIEWHEMTPVSLSYDHRVVNGADAGRFMALLQSTLDQLET